MSATSVAPRGAILRSTAPQRSKRRGARTRPPSLDARGFASWPVVRRDQVMWITFGDIAAVVVGSLVAGAWGPTCAALTAGVGACAVALAWLLGAGRVDVIDQARSGWRPVLGAGAIAALAALVLEDSVLPDAGAHAVLVPLALVTGLSLTNRCAAASWLRRRRLDGHGLRRTLIVMGSGAELLLRQLRRHPGDGFLIVGYLSSGQDRAFHSAEPVRSPQHIAQTLHAERIDAVMTVGSVIPEDLVTLMRGLEGTQVRLVVAPGLQDVVPGRMRALTVTHGWTGLIAVKTRRTRAAGKALFDRLAGAIGLALISPLLAATALAIRLDSPGPVFYTQTRVGQDGKPFTMWKFRSMYIDSDARRASVVKAGGDAGNEVMFKDRQDPRITRVGRWIRRLSIDELPQLINVVRGDMSLVGPRPALPVEVAKYDAEALRRLLVKPGLTGLWQISGRSDLSWASTVALDRHYVENRGGALDAKIFAGTLRAVIGGKGAY